jgi:hypothetical protein
LRHYPFKSRLMASQQILPTAILWFRPRYYLCALIIPVCVFLCSGQSVLAGGGGIVANKGACVVTLDFYTAHFTAYQPESSNNNEFCQNLPGPGETIFVLNYLHDSLKEVPVDFRIIKDVTGLGKFVRWEDVQKLGDLESHTVFYRHPTIEVSGSYRIRFDLPTDGDYIGIVSAGHPSNTKTYTTAFPFTVGTINYSLWLIGLLAAVLMGYLFWYRRVSGSRKT